MGKSYQNGHDNSGTTVKDEAGNLSSGQMEIEQRWKQYLESLPYVQDNTTTATETEELANVMPDITDENDTSIEEVKKAVEHMKNHK